MNELLASLDQGTTSTRCTVFDASGREVSRAQSEHAQILPAPGWVEHSPMEIWEKTQSAMELVAQREALRGGELAALGITNQRETTVVWDRHTGAPLYNAVVWQDARTQPAVDEIRRSCEARRVRDMTGLPVSTYFSAFKIEWILSNVPGARQAAENGDVLFGTIDTWLLWNLTGGRSGGVHRTDVTNASRTLLMRLDTLDWDAELLALFDIPQAMMPEIRPSVGAEEFGCVALPGPWRGVPITALVGDQQAALIGHGCFDPGDAKSTFGTGSFLLANTGERAVMSGSGLVTTVGYQVSGHPAVYALEGSIAVTGSAVQWLRDQLGVIDDIADVEALAGSVTDNVGVSFVPAFSGLFAPRWRPDARGTIVGLTRHSSKAHLARATLESICHQTREVVEAMEQDLGFALAALRVDGGVSNNSLCMQLQADVLGIPVVRSGYPETTSLGAAYAAGLGVGLWSYEDLGRAGANGTRWTSTSSAEQRRHWSGQWNEAVARAVGPAGADSN